MRPHSLDGLESEIRDHVERETRDNIDRGMAPDEARRAAMVAFGNVAGAREDVRAVWIPVWLEHLGQDIRYASASVVRNPIFSVMIILTLALGIGLSTTVLATFDSILLRPLDYPDAERLVSIRIANPDLPPDDDIATNQEYWALRGHVSSLDKLMAYQIGDQTLIAGNETARVSGAWVTDDFWGITAARAIAGRLPTLEERNVAVLSEHLYLSTFAGDPRVLGQVVTLDGVEVTVIGVVSKASRFQFPIPTPSGGPQPKDIDVFRSFTVSPPNPNFAQLLSIAGRLKPGVDVARARAELTALRIERPFSRNAAQIAIRVDSTAERLVRGVHPALSVLLASVLFVLLVACANITNLLLARATVRRKEIAVRISVGAGQMRVLRQFLFESAIYSLAGGTAGLLLARWSLAAMIRAYPQAVPRLAESSIHGSVVVAILSVLTTITLIFGLVPTLFVQRSDVQGILKEGTRTVTPSPDRLRIRALLAAAQLALAVTLLTGAGLMAKSFWRMNDHPAGFEPEHILTVRVDFPPRTTNVAKRDYATRVLARLKTLPEVEAVSLNTHGDSLTKLEVAGGPPSSSDTTLARIYANQTSADFARVMGLRLVKGRWLTDDEPVPVVVLNQTLAKLRFGGEDPIGKRVRGPDFRQPSDTTGRKADPESEVATVVGVISDLRYSKLDEEATPELYVPYAMTPGIYRLSLVAKTSGDPRALIPSVRGVINEINKTETAFDIMPLEQSLSESIAPRRLNVLVLGTFAMTALVLAIIGIYGVMSYSVSQRTHELGVRSAVGATSADIVSVVVWQGVRVAVVGIAAGIAGALIPTREMTSLLFETEPTDPATFVAAASMLALAALVASAVPALKAGAVDPIVALRYE